MSVFELAHLIIGIAFLASCLVMIGLGMLFDFWLEKRHRRIVGKPLMEPLVPFPLLTGFYCGMCLIAPGLGIGRGHRTSIGSAGRCVQWAARVNAVAVLLLAVTGALAWLFSLA